MNVIGKAILNWEKYTEYVQRETINVKEHPEDSWYLDIRYKVPHEVESIVWSCMRKIGEFKNGPIAIPKEEIVEEIKKHQQYLTSMNLYWDLMFYNSDAAEIRSGELVVVVPSYVIEKVMEFENVDDIPVNELRNRIGAADSGSHEVTQKYDLSRNQMKNKISATQEKINKKEAELEQLEKEKKEELERFRLELEKKYQSKMDLMNEKQEELKQQMEVLNRQMFLLNTEIYSIRCFMGETVDFIPLTTGAYSKVTDPLVVYQKIRYLDEELGKWISIYDVDGDDTALFEDMLKSRPDLRDMFVPGNKCISLVRAAHNKIRYCESKQIANTLKKYYVYHANKVGILVRDGENLWIGWTDQDRIDIPDGNVFYRPETKESSIEDSKGGQRTSTKEETASRYFIFSILQGLIHNGKLLHLPEDVQISKPNPYIVLSMADGWLEDDRYGTFSSIVERTSAPLQKGDMLLTTLSIKRDDAYSDKKYRAWDNDRGRGAYNRTYDASSLISFPILIAQIAGAKQNAVLKLLNSGYWFNTSKPWYTFGALIYLVLIFAFSYFYTEITMNPEEIANNIKKSGGNIAGIRAGSSTAEYLRKQMKYLIAIGSFCLCIIAIIPFIVSGLTGLSRLSFFGTSIIITVSVILETKKLILSKTQENYYMNRVKKGGLFRG